ncbi:MAG: hypothetical protein ABR924_05440 [Terracidiphilus sp.]
MAKEICISSTPHETRLAILEDDQLAEIYYERENEYTLAGSIYNGRVTRVLPGMQSAFVDVGLERDAFLYVTDFMELEDQEETDELEKAAASGLDQPPREVRRGPAPDGNGGRGEARPPRSGQKPDQKPESRPERQAQDRPAPDRQPKERRLAVEVIPDAAETAPQTSFASEPADGAQEGSAEPGAKRWRGRRRRRGSRGGPAGAPESQAEAQGSEEPAENDAETPAEAVVAPVIHAAASGAFTDRSSSQGWSTGAPGDATALKAAPAPTSQLGREAAPASRTGRAPTPFVLPGESLSKYGGVAEDEALKSDLVVSPAPPARPASTFKPATLIEAPLAWDGSGLLPGESISKHRARRPESAPEAEPQIPHAAAIQDSHDAPDAVEEEELVSERTEPSPAFAAERTAEDHFVVEEQSVEEEQLKPSEEAGAAEDHLAEEDDLEEEEYLRPVAEAQVEQTAISAPQPPAVEEPALPAPVEEMDEQAGEAISEPLAPSAIEPLADAVAAQQEAALALVAEASEPALELRRAAAEPAQEPLDFGADKAAAPQPAQVDPEPVAAPSLALEAAPETPQPPTAEPAELESDRAAAHRVDPLPPSAFRLFGLGGKKKAEKPAPEPVKPPTQPASVPSVSAYAPGNGVVVEELIEEEEFEKSPMLPAIIMARPRKMSWTTLKRRRCPRRCVPATWARCSRKPTSTTASS